MKAVVKVERAHGGVKVLELPEPELRANQVMVRIKNASICGSDLHAYHFSPTHLCNQFQIRGMHRDGIFAEYTVVEPKYLHKISQALTFEQACLVEPTSVLTHAVYDRSDIKGGDIVLVTGPGPIGLLAAQVVQAAGGVPVVAGIDSDEEIRLPLARKLGYQTINLSQDSLEGKLHDYFGRKTVHAVVECSGASPVVQQAIEVVTKGGSITLVGLFAMPVETNLSIAAPEMMKELHLNNTDIGLMGTLFSWTYAVMQLPVGWLVDRQVWCEKADC